MIKGLIAWMLSAGRYQLGKGTKAIKIALNQLFANCKACVRVILLQLMRMAFSLMLRFRGIPKAHI